MEAAACLRLFSQSWRGSSVTKHQLGLLSSNRRHKHENANNKFAGLSTQSCLQERTVSPDQLPLRQPHLPVYTNIELYRQRIALSDVNGDYLYEDVYMRSWDLAKGIIGLLGDTTQTKRICFLCPSGLTHVISTWACWLAGHVAVPLCPGSDQARLEHLVMEARCEMVITTKDLVSRVHSLTKKNGQKLIVLDETWWKEPKEEIDSSSPLPESFVDPEVMKDSNALILYTQGRTGRPKGVIYSHACLGNQIERVVSTWDWSSADSVLHVLKLDNVYGLINTLQAPLSTGARVTLMPKFDPVKAWSYLLGVGLNSGKDLPKINTFPGTPFVYDSLLQSYAGIFKDKKTKDYVKQNCSKRQRLMMSSTNTLPASLVQQWKNITGHRIMENFISTEAGTVLCSRVAGPGNRQGPGCSDCGAPVSRIQTQIVRFRDHTKTVHDVLAQGQDSVTTLTNPEQEEEAVVGELRIRGDGLATSYWRDGREEPICSEDLWFNTDDLVQYSKGCYKIWGRLNMKNINHKGTQVDAVKVEKKVLSNKDVEDCHVLGLGDIQAEQKLTAVIVLTKSKKINIENILDWCNQNMDDAEIPTTFKIVDNIERDNFGHVDKMKLRMLFPDEAVLCFHDSKL